MAEVCQNCGLPQDLCVCETIAKEGEKVKVYVERRRFGKPVTVVDNISDDMNPEQLTKKLKKKLACGGTYKEGRVELQGDHIQRLKKVLIKMGFQEEQLEIKG